MRLDVSVNMLTMQALRDGRITVFGGQQVRPNIHIKDMVAAYLHLLESGIPSGCYNAGFENLSLVAIASLVQKYVPADVVISGSNDPRSYRLNSDKLVATGFQPRFQVEDAIREIVGAVSEGRLCDQESWYNVKWMKMLV
jgi:nucleoside-diphosphate-sugar epimerase